MTAMKNAFTFDGRTYEMNDKGNRFFVTDPAKNICRKRISEETYDRAFEEYTKTTAEDAETEEWQEEANAELEARKDLQEEKDRETEDNFNGKRAVFSKDPVTGETFYHGFQPEKKAKKASKPRRSKDIAFEMDTLIGRITLTAKQVDFIHHLPDTNFWEHGLDSMPWCDCLADEIGGQFAGKPMTVGAMISTLREKKLITVGRDTSRQGKPKYMALTDVGKAVAKKLGLN